MNVCTSNILNNSKYS